MESNRKKKNKLPIILLAVLLLLAGGGCFAYANEYLSFLGIGSTIQEETTDSEQEEKTADPVNETAPVLRPDYSQINGSWISETTEDGRFLEFEINFPDVINFNDEIAHIERSDNSKYLYMIIFGSEDEEQLKFYISDLNGDSAKVWYSDDGRHYSNSLVLTRKNGQSEEVVDADTQSQSSTVAQSDSSGTSSSSSTKPNSDTASGNSSSGSEKKGHYEERRVCVQEAYDEQVLVKKGECTSVCVQEAYDTEEMVYLDGAFYGPDTEDIRWCYVCDHAFDDHCQVEGHPSTFKTVNITEPYWHNVEYRTVHHDAVYETQCEPDEYTTVHHDAVYETQMVWVED